MPPSSLEDTLAAAGYAKVICTLKPAAAADRQSAEAALASHFMVPSETQYESLALAAGRADGRSRRRGLPRPAPLVRVYPRLGLALGFADPSGVASLEADARIDRVMKAPELSLIRPVAAATVKPGKGVSWGIARLKADRLWAAGYTGKGVIVGHLDTGVDGSHPSLKGAIASFAEFDMTGDLVAGATPRDSGEHGTHTAGTIAGRGGSKGSFGVAPDARLASAMVIEGGQVIDRILGGMDWIIGEGARILSMSLGLRGYTPAFQPIVDALRAADVLPVFAVGNEYANTSRSPGNYANVLSVGASGPDDRVADFSGSQSFARAADPLVPDLVAPGVDVMSCVPGGQYAEMSGTSMATPHVAGLAALLLEAKPGASAKELEDAIIQSCARPAAMPQARANRGVPDAVKAFASLTGATLPKAMAVTRTVPGRRAAAVKRPSDAKAGQTTAKARRKANPRSTGSAG